MSPRSNARRLQVAGLALVIGALLAGCSDIYYDRRDTIALSTGDAVAANRVAQMVDPWPPASADRNVPANGEKMQAAVERYRQGRVIQPVNATTSSVAYQAAQQAANSANAATSGGAWAPPPTPSVK